MNEQLALRDPENTLKDKVVARSAVTVVRMEVVTLWVLSYYSIQFLFAFGWNEAGESLLRPRKMKDYTRMGVYEVVEERCPVPGCGFSSQ